MGWGMKATSPTVRSLVAAMAGCSVAAVALSAAPAVIAEGTYPPSPPPTSTATPTPTPTTGRIVPEPTIETVKPAPYVPGRYQTLITEIVLPSDVADKYGQPSYSVSGGPVQPVAAGQVQYFIYKVTKRGGLKVKVYGKRAVRIRAVIVIRPKAKYRQSYAPIVKRYTWVLKPKK